MKKAKKSGYSDSWETRMGMVELKKFEICLSAKKSTYPLHPRATEAVPVELKKRLIK